MPTPRPLVTILINNFNYGRYLGQAIDSALGQTYRDLEVVVVDDGSTDESRTVIAGYGERVVAILKPNGGQSSAINAGFRASRGEIICLLDSDDWFRPDKVERIVAALASFAQAGWAFHPLRRSYSDGSTWSEPAMPELLPVDERRAALRGKLYTPAPPTSGLSFRRGLAARMLPMPEQIRIVSDNYLKLAAKSLAPGILLGAELAAQRIHDANAYTLRRDRLLTQARVHFLIAQELRARFPQFSRLCDKVFSRALADYVRGLRRDRQCEAAIVAYLRDTRFLSIVDIFPRALYHGMHRR